MLIVAAPAAAEVRGGAFTVTPFVGGYTFDGVQHIETNAVTGLALGYKITVTRLGCGGTLYLGAAPDNPEACTRRLFPIQLPHGHVAPLHAGEPTGSLCGAGWRMVEDGMAK